MANVQSLERRRVTVNVCLDLGLLAKLDAAAERVGSSRSALLRQILEQGLAAEDADSEALVDEGLAMAMNEAAADPANRERIPWERVKGKLGL
ncbi:MAG: ribbon-helix-helix protein, CopG family [Armatimonadetes bacterium]|nr:ribbon-helix-helix protein, CopG family [Armatimonadota bacterium]